MILKSLQKRDSADLAFLHIVAWMILVERQAWSRGILQSPRSCDSCLSTGKRSGPCKKKCVCGDLTPQREQRGGGGGGSLPC